MSTKRYVKRVRQSPLNPMRWVLDLDCGHEVWVTAKSCPTRATAACPKCNELAAPSEGADG